MKCLRATAAGVCFLVSVSLCAQGRADETFPGQAYQRRETFTIGVSQIDGYVLSRDSGPATTRQGRFCFVVRPPNGAPYAYRVDSISVEPKQVRLVVHVLDLGPTGQQEQQDLPRLATRYFPPAEATYETARGLVEECEKAAADWEAHKAFLEEAFSKDPQAAHEGWRKIAADLERAHEAHARHLGILRDLIVAYSKLSAYEGQSLSGTNICALIPQRIAEFELKAGPLSPTETRTFRRALAMLYYQIGLYPLASAETAEDPKDRELQILKEAMQAIGQYEFAMPSDKAFEIKGELATYRVTVHEAAGTAPSPKILFHHWYFITRPKDESNAPGRVWYTLSSQTLSSAPRYYLYGHTGNRHKVLAMYGRKKPTYEQVKAKITSLMAEALKKLDEQEIAAVADSPGKPPQEAAGQACPAGRGLIWFLALAAAVAVVVVAVLVRRSRKAARAGKAKEESS